jgi:uncharacterized RDD family membrane protein YckC
MDNELRIDLPKKRKMKAEAGFIRRTIAFIIDMLIMQFTIITFFENIFSSQLPSDIRHMLYVEPSSSVYAASIFIALMIFIYFTFTEFITGKSIGKKVMSIKVESTQDELKLSQVLLRNLALLPFFPFIILWIADPLFMMFSKNQKRLSDILAKTRVIQVMRI